MNKDISLMLVDWYDTVDSFKEGEYVWYKVSKDYCKVVNTDYNTGIKIKSLKTGWYLTIRNEELLEKVIEPWKITLLDCGRDRAEVKSGDVLSLKDGTLVQCRSGKRAEFRELLKSDKVHWFYPVENAVWMRSR